MMVDGFVVWCGVGGYGLRKRTATRRRRHGLWRCGGNEKEEGDGCGWRRGRAKSLDRVRGVEHRFVGSGGEWWEGLGGAATSMEPRGLYVAVDRRRGEGDETVWRVRKDEKAMGDVWAVWTTEEAVGLGVGGQVDEEDDRRTVPVVMASADGQVILAAAVGFEHSRERVDRLVAVFEKEAGVDRKELVAAVGCVNRVAVAPMFVEDREVRRVFLPWEDGYKVGQKRRLVFQHLMRPEDEAPDHGAEREASDPGDPQYGVSRKVETRVIGKNSRRGGGERILARKLLAYSWVVDLSAVVAERLRYLNIRAVDAPTPMFQSRKQRLGDDAEMATADKPRESLIMNDFMSSPTRLAAIVAKTER